MKKQQLSFVLILFIGITSLMLSSCNKQEDITKPQETLVTNQEISETIASEMQNSPEFSLFIEKYFKLIETTLVISAEKEISVEEFNSQLESALDEDAKMNLISKYYETSSSELVSTYEELNKSLENFVTKYPAIRDLSNSEAQDLFTKLLIDYEPQSKAAFFTLGADCSPVIWRANSGLTEEQALLLNCPNWIFDCKQGFDLCYAQAIFNLESSIKACFFQGLSVGLITNTLSSGANVIAPGVSIVIGGTAGIITASICYQGVIDNFNEVSCPQCRLLHVEQCCD